MNNNKITIYHNPNCSKSCSTLKLLREHGVEPKIVEYLQHPPSVNTLKTLFNLLQIPIEKLVRQQEPIFQELNLNKDTLNIDDWLQILHENPTLLQRPIVVSHNQAVIARPPENALKLIQPDLND